MKKTQEKKNLSLISGAPDAGMVANCAAIRRQIIEHCNEPDGIPLKEFPISTAADCELANAIWRELFREGELIAVERRGIHPDLWRIYTRKNKPGLLPQWKDKQKRYIEDPFHNIIHFLTEGYSEPTTQRAIARLSRRLSRKASPDCELHLKHHPTSFNKHEVIVAWGTQAYCEQIGRVPTQISRIIHHHLHQVTKTELLGVIYSRPRKQPPRYLLQPTIKITYDKNIRRPGRDPISDISQRLERIIWPEE